MNSGHPYNQGIKALQNNLCTNINPYDEADHRYAQWLLGYSNAEQGKNQLASVNTKFILRLEDPLPFFQLVMK